MGKIFLWLLPKLGGFFKDVGAWMMAHFLGRVLVGGGLALVSYNFAVKPFFNQLHSMITSNAGQLALDWLGFFGLDKAITIIASAYVIRVSVSSMKLAKKSGSTP